MISKSHILAQSGQVAYQIEKQYASKDLDLNHTRLGVKTIIYAESGQVANQIEGNEM